MVSTPPSGGGIPPDLPQINSMAKANKPPLFITLNSNRIVVELQKGEGSIVAINRLESSNDCRITSASIPILTYSGEPSPIHVLPPNQALQLSTMAIEPSNKPQVNRNLKANGEDKELPHIDSNNWEFAFEHLENISEQANQHFMEPNSTTIAQPLAANRHNATTISATVIVVQLDRNHSSMVGLRPLNVQSPSQIENNCVHPYVLPSVVTLDKRSYSAPTNGQTSIEKGPVDKEKAVVSNATDKLLPTPSSIDIIPSGNVSAALLNNKLPALTKDLATQPQSQLAHIPPPSNFSEISSNFDKPPTTKYPNIATTQHHDTTNPNLLPHDTSLQAKSQELATSTPPTHTNTNNTVNLAQPNHLSTSKSPTTFKQSNLL